MYTRTETKCGADNAILPVLTAFRRIIELGILYGLPGKLRLITVENALCTHRIIEYCSRPRRGNFWPRTGTFPRRVSAGSGW